MHRRFGIHALTQEFVFLDQPDLLGHPPQKQPQLLEWRKRLGDVVVSAELHRLHRRLDGTMTGHERDFGARQKFLNSLQKLQARHVWHHHVA